MHRRAFRTRLHTGHTPLSLQGESCVLKVHNSISYGTKSNEELIQKNFNLAVEVNASLWCFETKSFSVNICTITWYVSCCMKNTNAFPVQECQVQNTAREYIRAYTTAAQSTEAFGEIPEWVTAKQITSHTRGKPFPKLFFNAFFPNVVFVFCRIIPIYLVHRPSNDIPYATLEEELIGDFVKYSVKDGKEINLMRRDSEAGQKCCAFQHWVYHKTDGNLLVTDMQGWEEFGRILGSSVLFSRAPNYSFCVTIQVWEWSSQM